MPYFLVSIGVFLIIINMRAIKKKQNSFNRLLKLKEKDISDFDVMIGEIRSEFSQTILELQKEILNLSEQITLKNVAKENSILIAEEKVRVSVSDNEAVKVDVKMDFKEMETESDNIKVNEIGTLLKQGSSVDEICEKFKIGRGEVLLIKGLYLK